MKRRGSCGERKREKSTLYAKCNEYCFNPNDSSGQRNYSCYCPVRLRCTGVCDTRCGVGGLNKNPCNGLNTDYDGVSLRYRNRNLRKHKYSEESESSSLNISDLNKISSKKSQIELPNFETLKPKSVRYKSAPPKVTSETDIKANTKIQHSHSKHSIEVTFKQSRHRSAPPPFRGSTKLCCHSQKYTGKKSKAKKGNSSLSKTPRYHSAPPIENYENDDILSSKSETDFDAKISKETNTAENSKNSIHESEPPSENQENENILSTETLTFDPKERTSKEKSENSRHQSERPSATYLVNALYNIDIPDNSTTAIRKIQRKLRRKMQMFAKQASSSTESLAMKMNDEKRQKARHKCSSNNIKHVNYFEMDYSTKRKYSSLVRNLGKKRIIARPTYEIMSLQIPREDDVDEGDDISAEVEVPLSNDKTQQRDKKSSKSKSLSLDRNLRSKSTASRDLSKTITRRAIQKYARCVNSSPLSCMDLAKTARILSNNYSRSADSKRSSQKSEPKRSSRKSEQKRSSRKSEQKRSSVKQRKPDKKYTKQGDGKNLHRDSDESANEGDQFPSINDNEATDYPPDTDSERGRLNKSDAKGIDKTENKHSSRKNEPKPQTERESTNSKTKGNALKIKSRKLSSGRKDNNDPTDDNKYSSRKTEKERSNLNGERGERSNIKSRKLSNGRTDNFPEQDSNNNNSTRKTKRGGSKSKTEEEGSKHKTEQKHSTVKSGKLSNGRTDKSPEQDSSQIDDNQNSNQRTERRGKQSNDRTRKNKARDSSNGPEESDELLNPMSSARSKHKKDGKGLSIDKFESVWKSTQNKPIDSNETFANDKHIDVVVRKCMISHDEKSFENHVYVLLPGSTEKDTHIKANIDSANKASVSSNDDDSIKSSCDDEICEPQRSNDTSDELPTNQKHKKQRNPKSTEECLSSTACRDSSNPDRKTSNVKNPKKGGKKNIDELSDLTDKSESDRDDSSDSDEIIFDSKHLDVIIRKCMIHDNDKSFENHIYIVLPSSSKRLKPSTKCLSNSCDRAMSNDLNDETKAKGTKQKQRESSKKPHEREHSNVTSRKLPRGKTDNKYSKKDANNDSDEDDELQNAEFSKEGMPKEDLDCKHIDVVVLKCTKNDKDKSYKNGIYILLPGKDGKNICKVANDGTKIEPTCNDNDSTKSSSDTENLEQQKPAKVPISQKDHKQPSQKSKQERSRSKAGQEASKQKDEPKRSNAKSRKLSNDQPDNEYPKQDSDESLEEIESLIPCCRSCSNTMSCSNDDEESDESPIGPVDKNFSQKTEKERGRSKPKSARKDTNTKVSKLPDKHKSKPDTDNNLDGSEELSDTDQDSEEGIVDCKQIEVLVRKCMKHEKDKSYENRIYILLPGPGSGKVTCKNANCEEIESHDTKNLKNEKLDHKQPNRKSKQELEKPTERKRSRTKPNNKYPKQNGNESSEELSDTDSMEKDKNKEENIDKDIESLVPCDELSIGQRHNKDSCLKPAQHRSSPRAERGHSKLKTEREKRSNSKSHKLDKNHSKQDDNKHLNDFDELLNTGSIRKVKRKKESIDEDVESLVECSDPCDELSIDKVDNKYSSRKSAQERKSPKAERTRSRAKTEEEQPIDERKCSNTKSHQSQCGYLDKKYWKQDANKNVDDSDELLDTGDIGKVRRKKENIDDDIESLAECCIPCDELSIGQRDKYFRQKHEQRGRSSKSKAEEGRPIRNKGRESSNSKPSKKSSHSKKPKIDQENEPRTPICDDNDSLLSNSVECSNDKAIKHRPPKRKKESKSKKNNEICNSNDDICNPKNNSKAFEVVVRKCTLSDKEKSYENHIYILLPGANPKIKCQKATISDEKCKDATECSSSEEENAKNNLETRFVTLGQPKYVKNSPLHVRRLDLDYTQFENTKDCYNVKVDNIITHIVGVKQPADTNCSDELWSINSVEPNNQCIDKDRTRNCSPIIKAQPCSTNFSTDEYGTEPLSIYARKPDTNTNNTLDRKFRKEQQNNALNKVPAKNSISRRNRSSGERIRALSQPVRISKPLTMHKTYSSPSLHEEWDSQQSDRSLSSGKNSKEGTTIRIIYED